MQNTITQKSISIGTASKIYGLSKSSFYRHINAGKIGTTKFGSRTFLNVKELDELFLGKSES